MCLVCLMNGGLLLYRRGKVLFWIHFVFLEVSPNCRGLLSLALTVTQAQFAVTNPLTPFQTQVCHKIGYNELGRCYWTFINSLTCLINTVLLVSIRPWKNIYKLSAISLVLCFNFNGLKTYGIARFKRIKKNKISHKVWILVNYFR